MKTGITRKVDDLGRVVIPAGIRRSLGIREGEAVEVAVEGDQVILFKPVDQCVFCREEEGLRKFRGKSVCRSCVAAVGVLDDSLRTPAAGDGRGAGDLPPWDLDERQREPSRRRSPRDEAPQPAPPAPQKAKQAQEAQEEPGMAAAARHPAAGQDADDEPPASTTAW